MPVGQIPLESLINQSRDDLEMTPVKGIEEKDLDKTIEESLDRMYSRIDVLHKKGRKTERKIRSRLKDFDVPDIDLDELRDISKLRSKLDKPKDLEIEEIPLKRKEMEEKTPKRTVPVKIDEPPSFASVIMEEKKREKTPMGTTPTETDKPPSFASAITEEKRSEKAELKKPIPEKKEGEKKKRRFLSTFKKKKKERKEKKRGEREKEIEQAAVKVAWEEEEKETPLPEVKKIDIDLDKGKKKEKRIRKERRIKGSKVGKPPVSGEEGEERFSLRQMALRRREKNILKRDLRLIKLEKERKKMVKVSDRLKIRREMATENERHIIDNLAHTGVELASIYKRLAAYLIDVVVIVFLTMLLIVIFPKTVSLWLVLYIIIGILYFSLTEGIFSRGLGKKIMNIYTTNINFEYVGFGNGILQSLFKSLPILNIIDGIFALINPLTRQRLSNKWTDTIVISGY